MRNVAGLDGIQKSQVGQDSIESAAFLWREVLVVGDILGDVELLRTFVFSKVRYGLPAYNGCCISLCRSDYIISLSGVPRFDERSLLIYSTQANPFDSLYTCAV